MLYIIMINIIKIKISMIIFIRIVRKGMRCAPAP